MSTVNNDVIDKSLQSNKFRIKMLKSENTIIFNYTKCSNFRSNEIAQNGYYFWPESINPDYANTAVAILKTPFTH